MTQSAASTSANDQHETFAEELRAMATSLANHAEVVSNIERLVGEQLGVSATRLRSEAIIPPARDLNRYVASRRTQSRCWLKLPEGAKVPERLARAVTDSCIELFVKAGRRIRNLSVDVLLNRADTHDVLLPFHFGSFETAGQTIAVWQVVHGDHFGFETLSPELGRRLMNAVAAVNAMPADDFDFLPDETRWVLAPPDYYREIYDRMDSEQRDKWRGTYAATLSLVGPEGALTERVHALGGGLLTHNDINRNNVLFPRDGPAALIDWEGATLGFPGADLRFLQKLDAKDFLLDCYVERANDLGLSVERADVLAGYRIAEGMRKVYRGWAVMSLLPVQSGLALVQSVLDKRAN